MSPRPSRVLSPVAALVVAVTLTGCQAKTDTERQFDAAQLRAATALTKVDPTLEAAAAESMARATVVSTSTPRVSSELAVLEPLGEGREGWTMVVRVEVEDDGGLFGGSTTESRCYRFELDADADRVNELPSDVVPCE